MARSIRIAVNLLLVVCLTMQSTIACAFQKACSVTCTSQFSCNECGCCKVEKPTDRCGCCGGHSNSDSDGDSASCCGNNGTYEPLATPPTADTRFADKEIAKGLVPGDTSCCAEASDEPDMDSACHCLQAPDTPYAPVSRSHANDVPDLLALGFTLTEIVKPKDQPVSVSANANALLSRLLHFSQIQLCVWRL